MKRSEKRLNPWFVYRLRSHPNITGSQIALDCFTEPQTEKLKPVNPKASVLPILLVGRTDAEAEAPMFWPHDAKSQLTGKNPDVGKDCGQEEKGTREDEIVGWHHQLNGHEFVQTLGGSGGQRSLTCCSPWVGKSQT